MSIKLYVSFGSGFYCPMNEFKPYSQLQLELPNPTQRKYLGQQTLYQTSVPLHLAELFTNHYGQPACIEEKTVHIQGALHTTQMLSSDTVHQLTGPLFP